MTYTFKLSRRLARLRDAAVIAASLFTLSCTDGPNGPGSTAPATDPTSVVIAPDSVSVGANQTVQFAAATTDSSGALSFNLASGKGRGRRKVVSVAVSPVSSSVVLGGSEGFNATATLNDGSTVQTSLAWTATGGTVDTSGKYTAGKVTGKYRVVATASNGVADTAAVSITAIAPILAQIVLSPASISLPAGGSQQFTAEGKSADSATVSVTPTYTATGGTISSAGVYTAGQTPGTFRVVATDPATGVADTSAVTITALGATLQSVVLTPATASVAQGAKQQFSASGRMSDGSTVPISPSFAATGGSISSSGEYTAGSTAGTYRVIATDQASGNADTSSVTIIASPATLQAVVLTPSTISLTTGGTQQFSASGRMSDGSTSAVTVTWSASGGTISSTGFYTAGQTAGTFRTIAMQSGGSLADTATVSVTAPTPPPPDTTVALLLDEPFANFAKWQTEKCCAWSQSIVTNLVREGTTAARFELRRTDPSPSGVLNGSQRSELLRPQLTGWTRDANGPFKAGDETWFGFSIFIPTDWINDAAYTPGGGEILQQLHEQPDGNNYSKNRTSFLYLLAEAGNFRWISRWDDCTAAQICWKPYGVENPSLCVGPLDKGTWTDWVIHAKWSYVDGGPGLLEIWKNGTKCATQTGPNNYNTQQAGFFKLGVYKWSWQNTNIPVRIVGYDNVRIAGSGGSYATVAPR